MGFRIKRKRFKSTMEKINKYISRYEKSGEKKYLFKAVRLYEKAKKMHDNTISDMRQLAINIMDSASNVDSGK